MVGWQKKFNKEDKIMVGIGSVDSGTQLHDTENLEIPNISVGQTSDGDFDRGSDASVRSSLERKSRRSKQRQMSRAQLGAQTIQNMSSDSSDSSSSLPEEIELVKRRSISLKKKNSLAMTYDS